MDGPMCGGADVRQFLILLAADGAGAGHFEYSWLPAFMSISNAKPLVRSDSATIIVAPLQGWIGSGRRSQGVALGWIIRPLWGMSNAR